MPVGLSFLGAAYDDSRLLQFAGAYEAATRLRVPPPRTPALDDSVDSADTGPRVDTSPLAIELRTEPVRVIDEPDGSRLITVTAWATTPAGSVAVRVFLNGTQADVSKAGDEFSARIRISASEANGPHSEWLPPYGPIIVVLATDGTGGEAGDLVELS